MSGCPSLFTYATFVVSTNIREIESKDFGAKKPLDKSIILNVEKCLNYLSSLKYSFRTRCFNPDSHNEQDTEWAKMFYHHCTLRARISQGDKSIKNDKLLRSDNKTELDFAALHGDVKKINKIFEKDPKALPDSDTMDFALQSTNKETILKIHSLNLNLITSEDRQNQTLIHHAAEMGDPEIITLLHGLNPNLIAMRAMYGETVMHAAARNGNPEVIALLHRLNPNLIEKQEIVAKLQCIMLPYMESLMQ
ncbi:MAG: ankyrin repeat domain-containing protein [Parachlamydiales bacterium]|jgi:hypothetical protein